MPGLRSPKGMRRVDVAAGAVDLQAIRAKLPKDVAGDETTGDVEGEVRFLTVIIMDG